MELKPAACESASLHYIEEICGGGGGLLFFRQGIFSLINCSPIISDLLLFVFHDTVLQLELGFFLYLAIS